MESFITCSRCKTLLYDDAIFCDSCGYPEKGDANEKYKFQYNIKIKEEAIEEANKKLRHVKILLYVIAGINFLIGLFYMANEATFSDGIASLIAAAIFLGCVIWVKEQPLTGVLAAFVFWIVLQLSVIFVDPSFLMKGLLLKVIFIAIFIKGISSAREVKQFSKQLKEMGT